jgi:hypothetical protein
MAFFGLEGLLVFLSKVNFTSSSRSCMSLKVEDMKTRTTRSVIGVEESDWSDIYCAP